MLPEIVSQVVPFVRSPHARAVAREWEANIVLSQSLQSMLKFMHELKKSGELKYNHTTSLQIGDDMYDNRCYNFSLRSDGPARGTFDLHHFRLFGIDYSGEKKVARGSWHIEEDKIVLVNHDPTGEVLEFAGLMKDGGSVRLPLEEVLVSKSASTSSLDWESAFTTAECEMIDHVELDSEAIIDTVSQNTQTTIIAEASDTAVYVSLLDGSSVRVHTDLLEQHPNDAETWARLMQLRIRFGHA